MSYQLIHAKQKSEASDTTPPELCDIACSTTTPASLKEALAQLSHKLYCNYTHTQGCIYSYRILTCDATPYHILTAATRQPAHSAYNYICHHTVLTEDEVVTLRRNSARPTPAGIICALQSSGHWYTQQTALPPQADKEPMLSASQLPDARTQPTWKELTGHKRNAAVLLTPPYTSATLVCCPPRITEQERLLLLHEATWLMPTRGWGKTFCTECTDKTADFHVTEIMLTTTRSEQAAAIAHTQRIPMLQLYHGLNLHLQDDANGLSTVAHPLAANPQPQVTPQAYPTAEHGTNIYKYTEAPDHECFFIPPPKHKKWRSFKYIGILFGVTTAVYIVVCHYADFFSPQPEAPQAPAVTATANQAIQQFRDILRRQDSTDDALNKLHARLRDADAAPYARNLADCIRILTTDINKTHGHPENLLFLAEQAKAMHIPVADITNYYLLRVIKDYPVEEWVAHNTTAPANAAWARFFNTYPNMVQEWQAHADYHAHIEPLIRRHLP